MLDRMCLLQETSFASFWTDFLAIVSGRAENLGEGLEAQVMKVDNKIFEKKNVSFFSATGG